MLIQGYPKKQQQAVLNKIQSIVNEDGKVSTWQHICQNACIYSTGLVLVIIGILLLIIQNTSSPSTAGLIFLGVGMGFLGRDFMLLIHSSLFWQLLSYLIDKSRLEKAIKDTE